MLIYQQDDETPIPWGVFSTCQRAMDCAKEAREHEAFEPWERDAHAREGLVSRLYFHRPGFEGPAYTKARFDIKEWVIDEA